MGFSDELREKGGPIWDKEKAHPFVTGMGRGDLSPDRFDYYMRQDYIYLIEYCRGLALALAKAQELEDMGWIASLLHATLNTEMALHRSFCQELGIGLQELEQTQPSPTTMAYTRYLLKTAYSGSLGEIIASLLPCQWGYCEIGQALAKAGAPAAQPYYARWIEMYNSPEFAELADGMRGMLDRLAADSSPEELHRMEEAFLISSRYEYLFWDAAYSMEEWPI